LSLTTTDEQIDKMKGKQYNSLCCSFSFC